MSMMEDDLPQPQTGLIQPPPMVQGAPNQPQTIPQPTRDQRMVVLRNLLSNFMYSLGSGLSASGATRGTARQKTQAGMGAAFRAPFELEEQQRQRDIQNQQLQMQRERLTGEQQDRDLRAKQFDLSAQQFAQAMATGQRNQAIELLKAMTGMPAPWAVEGVDAGPRALPSEAVSPQGGVPYMPAPVSTALPSKSGALRPVDIPGYGQVTPPSAEEIMRRAGQTEIAKRLAEAQAKMMEPYTLNAGDARFVGNRQIASVPAKQTTTYVSENITVDGKETKAIRDNQGNYFYADTKEPIKGKIGIYKPPSSIMQPSQAYTDLDDKTKARVDAVRDKVAAGEYTVQQGLSALGGVRGGLGGALTEALGEVRVLPPAVRQANTDIERTKNLLVPIHQLIGEINATSDPGEKLKKSYQLENYVSSIGTQFARAKGERGVVTDRDVNRVLGLLPGWRSANFAPKFAEENLSLIEQAFARDQAALLSKYFTTVNKPGGANSSGGSKTTTGNVFGQRGPGG